MKYYYSIVGMTCNGCKASVEKALAEIKMVRTVEVDLNTHQAVLDLEVKLPVEKLQQALPEKFTITEIDAPKDSSEVLAKTVKTTSLKTLMPLFLILGAIVMVSLGLNFKTKSVASFMLDYMGLFFVVFSFFKFLDLHGFVQSFRMYDPLAKQVGFYGYIYPFLEAGLGVLFLLRFQVVTLAVITIVILGITTIGVTQSLLGKKDIRCACLGSVLNLPMTTATFIENVLMIIMAISLLVN